MDAVNTTDQTGYPSASSAAESSRSSPAAAGGDRDASSQQDNGRSSLFDKLPEELRRRLDLAILHRIPPTFKDVWMQFELSKFGVSYSALYRYARRLRDRLNVAEAAFLSDDDEAGVDAAIQKLLSRRLLELLLHTNTADFTREIAALTAAHRKGAKTALDLQRLANDRDHLRLKAEFLEIARQRQPRLLKEVGNSTPASSNPVNLVNPVHSPDAQPLRLACSTDNEEQSAPAQA